ncbi:MAG: helix-hairpin-helix domain-containing protein [Chloroflexi bacterium]|nr:helix-hairpin-helix domain-containing protein [Chloroflexota bacterium]
MPELTARNIAFMVLVAATVAAVLGAVVLLARQNDNAPVRIIAPEFQQITPAQVRVYVNGAVAVPGVYTLDSDSRITDALAAAGGVTGEANLEGVNLALRVTDEAEYYVPRLGESRPFASGLLPGQTESQGQSAGLIDLNLASKELLDTLPGIGPALAGAIVSYRENVRPFQSVAEVQEVPKIGPATYLNIRDLVTVSGVR